MVDSLRNYEILLGIWFDELRFEAPSRRSVEAIYSWHNFPVNSAESVLVNLRTRRHVSSCSPLDVRTVPFPQSFVPFFPVLIHACPSNYGCLMIDISSLISMWCRRIPRILSGCFVNSESWFRRGRPCTLLPSSEKRASFYFSDISFGHPFYLIFLYKYYIFCYNLFYH